MHQGMYQGISEYTRGHQGESETFGQCLFVLGIGLRRVGHMSGRGVWWG